MTFELRILGLSVVLGLVQIVFASHAAKLAKWSSMDRRFTRRACAPVDWNSAVGKLEPHAPPPEKNIGRISQRFAHFCNNFAVCSFSAKT